MTPMQLGIQRKTRGRKRFLDFNYEVLHYFGLWPSAEVIAAPRNSWMYFRSLLPAMQIFRVSYNALFHAFALPAVWQEPHERARAFALMVANVMIITKLSILMRQKERIARVFNTLEILNGESGFVDEECEKVRSNAENRCRKFSKKALVTFLTVHTLITVGGYPQIIKGILLPLNVWFPEKTFWHYFVFAISLLSFTLAATDMFILMLVDVTMLVIAIQLICQFDILRCCSETQSIFSPATAFQIILSALLAMAALFISILVRKAGGEIDLIIIAVVFSMAGTSEFFIMCVVCDKLTERSSSIRQAAYACDWTEASEGFKLSLRIIISRTSKPIIFRAIGVPLSLPTFRAVMRAVYYVYTMTMNIIDGRKIIEQRS